MCNIIVNCSFVQMFISVNGRFTLRKPIKMNQSHQEIVGGGTYLNQLIQRLQLIHFLLYFFQVCYMMLGATSGLF